MPVGRSTSQTHQVGAHAEKAAVDFLRQQGWDIIAQNWHVARVGEIDIICLDNSMARAVLVFVEVKKRKSRSFGGAAASVTPAKQRKIITTAQYFLAQHDEYADLDCRFDVIAIEGDMMQWYPAAFVVPV